MDPDELQMLMSLASTGAMVKDVLSVAQCHAVCVIVRPEHFDAVENTLRREAGEEQVLGGRGGEIFLRSGGMVKMFSSGRLFGWYRDKISNLAQRRIRPLVVVSESDDDIWVSCDYNLWRRRELPNPPPVSWKRLLEE